MFLIPLTRIAFVQQPNQRRVGILIDWVVKSEETEANWKRQGSGFSWSRIMSRFGASFVRRLRKRPELQIVGEVADGLEAVRKAEELQPDLIVLDIGLPH